MKKKLSYEDKINAWNLGIGYYLGSLAIWCSDSKKAKKTIKNFYKLGLISKEDYEKYKNISKELTKLLSPLKNNALR